MGDQTPGTSAGPGAHSAGREGRGLPDTALVPLQRVLFVDDEPRILEGLENAMRKQRRVWEMVFAIGGQAALAELERADFDAVVSDMQMPGMDGAALLAQVKASYPDVARIVLSGHAEQDAVIRALPVAHQLLSKPCNGEHLRMAIDRVCSLQRLLRDDTIRQLTGGLEKLPSAADAYWALTRTLADPNASLAGIANIVERDPAMSAKVLQLVNSAYFGLPRQVTSILEAVKYLGTELIKGLVLTAQVFSAADTRRIEGMSVEVLQAHSLTAARLAKRLAGRRESAEDSFTAGLLHDIGQLVLALGSPARYGAVLRQARTDQRPLHEIEYEVLGVSHAEVGAHLLGVWGLPFAVVEAVAYHHRPSPVSEGERDLLAVVHVAEAVIEAGAAEPVFDLPFLQQGGWDAELPRWIESAREMLDELAPAGTRGDRRSS